MPNGEVEVIEDGVIAIRPAAQSRLLAQQQRFQGYLASLVKRLSGDEAPKDFNQLSALLHEAEVEARQENTRSLLS